MLGGGSMAHWTLTFLHALTIFFKSYSEESPCTVVKVLRPFRCWILIWTRPSWTSSSEPLIASAKGSANTETEGRHRWISEWVSEWEREKERYQIAQRVGRSQRGINGIAQDDAKHRGSRARVSGESYPVAILLNSRGYLKAMVSAFYCLRSQRTTYTRREMTAKKKRTGRYIHGIKMRREEGKRVRQCAFFSARFTHRMCWDSGWTYDKQKRSLGWYRTAERRWQS